MIFIEIDDKQYPIHYGHLAIKAIMDKHGKTKLAEIQEILQNIEMDEMPGVVKSGFDTAARIQKTDPPFSSEEILDLLDRHVWLSVVCIRELGDAFNEPARAQKKSANGQVAEPEPAVEKN